MSFVDVNDRLQPDRQAPGQRSEWEFARICSSEAPRLHVHSTNGYGGSNSGTWDCLRLLPGGHTFLTRGIGIGAATQSLGCMHMPPPQSGIYGYWGTHAHQVSAKTRVTTPQADISNDIQFTTEVDRGVVSIGGSNGFVCAA
jgi:hypothetical protein